jgi:hypothetical protein
MRFMKTVTAALVASIATLALAAPAFAEATPAKPAVHADGGAAGKHGKKFPMAGAEFKTAFDQKVATKRQHMESRIASLPADKQKEIRDKFNAGVAALNAEVARAVADNVVTKEEAVKVRELAKQLRGGHGGGHAHAHAKKSSDKK